MNRHIVELLLNAEKLSYGEPGVESFTFTVAIARELRTMDPTPAINKQSRSSRAYLDALEKLLPRWAS